METKLPLQELLVWDVGQLPRPAGVLFDPPCKTRNEDIKAWSGLLPAMASQMDDGRYIMVVVQCRNTRNWDAGSKQFKFIPKDDYVVASYSVAARLGTPYEPAYVSLRWVDKAFAKSQNRT